ncbi:MAG: leucyl aminopeptidase [Actinomycetota bacterium]
MPKLTYQTGSPADVDADVVILPMFEGPEAGPGVKDAGDALGTDLVALYRSNKLKGKVGEALTVPTLGGLPAATLLLVGLGKRSELTADKLRRGIGKVASRVSRFERVATTFPQVSRPSDGAMEATIEGVLLGAYRFDRYKGKGADPDSKPALREIVLLGSSRQDGAKEAIGRATIIAQSVAWARDLVNMPAKEATPEYLAKEAQRVAKEAGLKIKVWSPAELKRGGFGGILGVGQGSMNPPRLIELSYQGAGSARPYAITGKGVTFDSGGLSIKPAGAMEWMKADMAGAAAALATMRAIGLLRPRINVIAAIPCSENLPSGSSIRPGDVLVHRGGKTSEVLNTDAEGRLILADALAFLTEQKPVAVVDCATLTGAAVVALGDDITALFGNNQALTRQVLAASEAVGEPAWELPLWDDYRKLIDSPIADVKNTGPRGGGAITAALFLREFVGDVPWVHLDVAGAAYSETPGDYWPKGGTGMPARTLIRWLLDRAGDGRARRASGNGSRAKAATSRTRSGAGRPRSTGAARKTPARKTTARETGTGSRTAARGRGRR